jgi:hypothetical protein
MNTENMSEKARQEYKDQISQDTEGGCSGNGGCYISGFTRAFEIQQSKIDELVKAISQLKHAIREVNKVKNQVGLCEHKISTYNGQASWCYHCREIYLT